MEINIAPQSVSGNCDLKCAYNFKYSSSNSTITNKLYFLSMSYDQQKESPVTYNGSKYNVSTIKLYKPSLHKYLGTKIDAELIIEHNPVNGGELLRVCIPITKSVTTGSTQSSQIITNIIKTASSSAPARDDQTKISDFSLQSVLPTTQFYSYYNNHSVVGGDYVVFGKLSALTMNDATLSTLGRIIQPFDTQMMGDNLFLNPTGPNKTKENIDGDGIYIDCQPTGASEETIDVVSDIVHFDIFDDPNVSYAIKLIMSSLLFIVFLVAFNMFYNKYLAKSVAVKITP
jgi:hypothetical protein